MGEGSEPVVSARQGTVTTVTILRPAQANSLTRAAKEGLLDALRGAARDASVRAVVLTGSGNAFCAGQDLSEHARALSESPGTAFATVAEHYSPIVRLLATMPKPTLAAINGTCAGAGLGFALACDIRLASEGARFATAFAGIGLSADSGLSVTLPRAVGWTRAMGLFMLGEAIGAAEALRIGLVHEVVAASELSRRAAQLGARLASGPTHAFAALKRAMWESASSSMDAVLALEAELQSALALTADHQRAVRAFLEKRPAEFEGR
jgi:2-(1,2-epoxy-1,2-dihydrophenyl)acetyl-CoA isomerase